MPEEDIIEKLNKELKETRAQLSAMHNFVGIQDLKISIFQSFGKITANYFDLDKMLDNIMEMIIKTMKVEAGSILLLNPDTELLEFKVVKGVRSPELKKCKLGKGEGVVAFVAETGKALVVPDAHNNKNYRKYRPATPPRTTVFLRQSFRKLRRSGRTV